MINTVEKQTPTNEDHVDSKRFATVVSSIYTQSFGCYWTRRRELSHRIVFVFEIIIVIIITSCGTGCPTFLLHFQRVSQSLCLALLSHAAKVPVCKRVTHSLSFIGSGVYSLSFFIFPLDARFDSRRELTSPLADLSSWPYQIIKPAF